MGKYISVEELPIYKEHFDDFIEILKTLEDLKSLNNHKELINSAYINTYKILPLLNAGYNYWGLKGKLKIYNEVRILLSKLQLKLQFLFFLKILKKDYNSMFNNCIKYMNGLIKKLESPNPKNG